MPDSPTISTTRPPRRGSTSLGSKLLWPLVGLGLLLLFNFVFTRNFFHLEVRDGHLFGQLIDVLNHGSKVMILSLGMTLVIATGGVDLSVGAIMAIAGAIAALLVNRPDTPFPVVIGAALAASLLAGAWNGMLVAVFRIQPIVATLILMVAGRGIAQLITDGQYITFTDPRLVFVGNGHLLFLPFTVTIVAVLLLLTAGVLRGGTAVGLFIESVGDNETASRFSGINARFVKFLTYVFSGLCAGVAGLVAASNIRCADSNHAGLYLELDAILAVVVGGTALTGGRFYLLGSVVGAMFIQTLTTTMLARDVSPDTAPVPKALVIVAVCLLQSATFRRKAMLLLRPGAWADLLGKVACVFAPRRHGETPRPPNTASPTGAPPPSHAAPSRPRQRRPFLSRIPTKYVPLLATAGVLAALYVGGCLHYRNFASLRVVVDLFGDNAFTAVAAFGATFVILSGGIDLSVGSVIAFTGIFLAATVGAGWPPAVAIPVVLAIGVAFGAGMGCLIQFFDLPPFLVTLAGMFLARGMGFVIHSQSMGIKHAFFRTTVVQDLAIPLTARVDLPFTAVCMLGVFVVALYVAHYTRFGRCVYALGGSENSAKLMGLPVARSKVLIYALAGLCSTLAGVVYTFYTQSGDPAACVGQELDVIASVVIGGTLLSGGVGFVAGTLMGVLILGLIQTIITFQGDLNTWWTKIAVGGLVLVFILLQNFVQAASRRKAA